LKQIATRSNAVEFWSWSFRREARLPEPIDAEFQDVADATEKQKKTDEAVVLIAGSKK
jgi:hypothetical protein